MLYGSISFAQDFSNKGKDFYLCFPAHVQSSNLATLSIWITSDRPSTGMVTMGNGAFTQAFSITANGLAEIRIPHAAAHISNIESNMVIRKSIRVKVDAGKPPVVAYAQQWAGARSAATLLLPVNVLGKKYHSINFTQNAGGRSQFDIIAVKNNTVVEITPVVNGAKGTTITVNLPLAGDMYQYQSSNVNADLTGTFIESIASAAGGCLPIAVFSGSSNVSLGITGCSSFSSADPLFQQLYPVSTWGKNFGFIPFANYPSGTPYRVMASEDGTNVFFNGALVATLNAGQIFPSTFTSQPAVLTAPTSITADKPICVAQYAQSNGCSGQGSIQGDPDMVILNPIEQNISDITIFSTRQEVINTQWINVLMKTNATASFRIARNGGFLSPPTSAWQAAAALPGYSYLRELLPVPAGTSDSYRLVADSGFNAIAYGWGNNESYAYSAGTNVKDLYQQIGTATGYGGATSPSVCIGSPTKFKISLPYPADSIYWDFQGSQSPNVKLSNAPSPITPDSITTINGKSVYWYSLPLQYTFNTAGVFPALITTYSPNSDGCGNEQEIDIEIEVINKPLADFNFSTDGCVTNPVLFTESNTSARPITTRHWNFGDATTATTTNPTHTYVLAGSYNVKYTYINDIGCIADTARKTVVLNNPPTANFSTAGPYCAGNVVSFSDLSSPIPGGTYAWNFGDAGTSNLQNPTHIYNAPGTYTVSLTVTSVSGCSSFPFTFPVTISPKPTADFTLPGVCLPSGNAQFNDGSIPGTGNTITGWAWDFGDGNTSTAQNPSHVYLTPSPFTVTLTVTTNTGCTDTKSQLLTTVYAEPQAAFTAPLDVCLGSVVNFTDGSTAPANSVTGWNWDFGDGNTSTLKNPTHTYATAGPFTVTLNVTSAAGCATVNNFATKTITVRTLPTAVVSIAGTASVCQNGTQPTITFTGSGGTAPYTFTYSIDNGSGPVVQPPVTTVAGNSRTINVPTTTAGTYRYALINVQEGSTANCSQPQTGFVDVVVRQLPGATVTGSTEACLNGTSPNITFTGTNGVAPYTFNYRINGGPILTATTAVASSSVTVAVPTGTANTFVYTLESVGESSVNACTQNLIGSASATVIVKAPPTATIIGSAEVCFNALAHSITFTGAGGTAPYTFSYRINGGPVLTAVSTAPSNIATVTVPTNVATTYTYSLVSVQEGSLSGCSQSQTGSVITTVNPLPTANFTPSAPICQSRIISFSDASVPNAGSLVTWAWDFGDGNTSTVQNPTHTYALAGPYNVKLIATTNKGCVSTETMKTIQVDVNPKADFNTPVACINDVTAQFTDLGTINPGSVTGWEWNFGDVNSTGANPNTSTVKNPTHHFTVAGPYTIRQIVISNTGCRDTITKTFTVNDVPVSNFSIENVGSVCSNQVVNIKDAATTAFGKVIKVEIFWDYLNDPTARTTDVSPSSGKSYTHTYPEFGTPATRTARIRYVAYTGDNCISSFDRDVTLLATPTLVFDAVNGICADVPAFQVTQARLLNALPGPAGIFTGAGISATGLFDPAVAGAGSHLIRFTFTGANGCSNFVEQTIDVYPVPTINAGPDKVVLQGGQVSLTPSLSIGGPSVTYLWTPPAGLNNVNVPSPISKPDDDITYTLTVTTINGCSDNDQVFVKVLKAPLIPNIFSPNGDGVHDRWEIPYLQSYPGCTIDLYNRYGQLVYRSVGYATAWDGKANGKDVPVGTYYYVIDPKNGRQKIAGYVDIIR
jgi:gliding motility-associated-like protein